MATQNMPLTCDSRVKTQPEKSYTRLYEKYPSKKIKNEKYYYFAF
jgi:hypothetical protein